MAGACLPSVYSAMSVGDSWGSIICNHNPTSHTRGCQGFRPVEVKLGMQLVRLRQHWNIRGMVNQREHTTGQCVGLEKKLPELAGSSLQAPKCPLL